MKLVVESMWTTLFQRKKTIWFLVPRFFYNFFGWFPSLRVSFLLLNLGHLATQMENGLVFYSTSTVFFSNYFFLYIFFLHICHNFVERGSWSRPIFLAGRCLYSYRTYFTLGNETVFP